MKLGPVPKLDKRNKARSKKVDDEVKLENCDVMVIFPLYGQFGSIRKLDPVRIVCKTYIFTKTFYLNSNIFYNITSVLVI